MASDEEIRSATYEAIDRWEQKTGWIADFAVVQGFQIVVDEQYAELVKENRRMSWVLQSVLDPSNEGTLWDTYERMDDSFWGRMGLE